jgi:hypothetical protein
MITSVGSDDILKEVFFDEREGGINPLLIELLRNLFLTNIKYRPHQVSEWRKDLAEEIVCRILIWYLVSDSLKTRIHDNHIMDTIHIIGKMSSGRNWDDLLREETKRVRKSRQPLQNQKSNSPAL